MKKGYKCEDMYRILSKKYKKELHNAVLDAEDELKIMKMLGYNINYYDKANAEVEHPIPFQIAAFSRKIQKQKRACFLQALLIN